MALGAPVGRVAKDADVVAVGEHRAAAPPAIGTDEGDWSCASSLAAVISASRMA